MIHCRPSKHRWAFDLRRSFDLWPIPKSSSQTGEGGCYDLERASSSTVVSVCAEVKVGRASMIFFLLVGICFSSFSLYDALPAETRVERVGRLTESIACLYAEGTRCDRKLGRKRRKRETDIYVNGERSPRRGRRDSRLTMLPGYSINDRARCAELILLCGRT